MIAESATCSPLFNTAAYPLMTIRTTSASGPAWGSARRSIARTPRTFFFNSFLACRSAS